MEEIKSVALNELIRILEVADIYKNEIVVIEIFGKEIGTETLPKLPVRLDAFSLLLVSKGELVITMDYLPYRVTQNMVLELTDKYMLNSISASHDARGYYVVLAKTLFKEVLTHIYTMPKEYFTYKRFNPTQKLDSKDFRMLMDIVIRLQKNIRRTDHVFHRGIVMNEIGNLTMELADISLKHMNLDKTEYELGPNGILAMKFMQLIVTYGRKWNEVSQYSTELCVTPVYLSRAIKAVSGKTAMEWINEARVSEARIMLRNKDMAIQEISEELNFSDQSSFGKFFKKHTGMSPLEYRRSLY